MANNLDTYLAMKRGRLVELARELGVRPQYLCDVRKGRREPSLGLALRISKATGVPIESLVRRAA